MHNNNNNIPVVDEKNIPEGKILKTSITKAELAELPAAPCNGRIIMIDSDSGINEAVADLRKSSIIGFDTETKPSFKRGEHHFVSLLQLSTRENCYLFRLNIIGLPEEVKKLLEDDHITKVGLSIHDDFLNLHKKFELEPKGFIDLQSFVKDFNISDNSLSRIYGILFGKRISKGQRLSNWEAPVLTQFQQEYAALDAFACLDIYYYLKNTGFNYKQSKYYRLFDDPNVQQQQQSDKQ